MVPEKVSFQKTPCFDHHWLNLDDGSIASVIIVHVEKAEVGASSFNFTVLAEHCLKNITHHG